MNRILIVDDDMDMCALLSRFLQRKGFETETAFTGNSGISKFKEQHFDIVLCDFRLGDKEGNDVLREVKSLKPATTVIIITGYSDIKTAVDVIKQGAFDYIAKPLIPDEVLSVIKKSQSHVSNTGASASSSDTNTNKQKGKQALQDDEYLVGRDPATKELYKQIKLVAPTPYSVILYGESGTGKEVIGKTIHQYSDRANKPFIALDCGTLSKELAGSELFGHMKGSFTGAINDKEGHFEMANGGTIFLDEVGNLPIDVQAALLRVIQERRFKRVGGTKEMNLDIRIIVASNENLQEGYRKGKFREDLFHRFNEFSIHIPALRDRKEDILLFADFFLQKACNELDKKIEGFEDEVLQLFIHYPWPGNLREFRNVIRRAALLTNTLRINASVLPNEIIQPASPGEKSKESGFHNIGSSKNPDLKGAASQAEYDTILKVLKQVNYNKTKAAEILKIDRKTLYNKIKDYESPKTVEE
ncbi:sigma-54 dependent transcriptional regulator [Agriterribacter sp.]|uniref:sigma-54-dependent transcriptional regulator n=1 Tax=Agriterribacter sp. TaxID=2821509 RepID=UPI002C5E73B1|nr:sigma-54 dependent transcriptional regulator [Agriterribacter sp.]HRP55574.1 sigma-54 dependent transcriptional regulator [Agriterribacter sp.]